MPALPPMRLTFSAFPVFLAAAVTGHAAQLTEAPRTFALPALATPARDELEAAAWLLVVTTPDWNAPRGTFMAFHRAAGTWALAQGPDLANVGIHGTAWGRGLTVPPEKGAAPVKKEGDMRAPAGIFRVVRLMGYAAQPPEGVELPYRQVTSTTWCVEDEKSPDYNRVVDVKDRRTAAWKKGEVLGRTDHLYRLFLALDHNGQVPGEPVIPGAGSCAFFHIARRPVSPTAGCVSIEPQRFGALLGRVDALEHALYVGLPVASYRLAVDAWGLPRLPGL